MNNAVESSETCQRLTVTLVAPAARNARPMLITPSALLMTPEPVLQADRTTDSDCSLRPRISDIDKNMCDGSCPSTESTNDGSEMPVSTAKTPWVAKCKNRNCARSVSKSL